jgi:hypothetical protein
MTKRAPAKITITAARFALDDKLRDWLDDRYPTIDQDVTLELFTDKALAKGWVYADWSAAFRNYMRRSKEWGGVEYKTGLDDPAYSHLIQHAKAIGFRMPNKLDTAYSYRDSLNEYDKTQATKQAALLPGLTIKRIPK